MPALDNVFSKLPFVIDVCGRFVPDHLIIDYDSALRPTTQALDALIAEQWERQLALARTDGRVLFNGDLLRYVAHDLHTDSQTVYFRLTVGATCYRDFVGTNLFNRQHLNTFGWRCFANPVGTTATLITTDGYICYGRRSKAVAYHGGYVHTFGGTLEKNDRNSQGTVDPFASVLRELREELAVETADLMDFICVGLLRDKEIYQPELLFEGRLKLTFAEVLERWRQAEAQSEHEDIVKIPDYPDRALAALQEIAPVAPVALGAVFLHGRQTWGEDWLLQACEEWPDRRL